MAVVVKKTNTILILMQAESVYDSPDSEVENYLVNNVEIINPADPDSCGTSKDTFNKLHALKRQDLLTKYQSSFTDEIPTKIPPTNFRDLSSLKQGSCIDESCLNDWAKHLINVFSLTESVLYIPTYLYRCFFNNVMENFEAEKLIRYLANNKALKKDYILVGIPATPIGRHWTLGVIMLNSQKITLLDPIDGSPGIDNRHYNYLMRITLLAHKLAGVEFYPDEWKLFYPLNIPRTTSQADAGIYVCYFIYKIAFRNALSSLLDTTARDFRRRIHYVLSSAKEILPQGDSKKYPREKLSQYIQYLSHNFRQLLQVQSFDAIALNSTPNMGVRECSDSFCTQQLNNLSDFDQLKCVGCRKYHHIKCSGADPSTDYFYCFTCSALSPISE
ncbi:uncharacterized protein LOC107369745 [Tetranychus urticae]|uniref:Ubiquitin-like protease family profile domain-containing protein n=1 Tax=Tetranychus urticae TaxID=32264 RepID=T1L2V5_TETUR|nr:uncharacterized protein LOC107369745 [Tetranychus urticae]